MILASDLRECGETARAFLSDVRTPRKFLDKDVPDALLQSAYDCAKWAPTAGNCAPARYVFLKDARQREKLKQALAPVLIEPLFSAPVIALGCIDPLFFNALPRIGSEPDLRDWFVRDVGLSEEVALKNASIQHGYFLTSARMAGLDVMPVWGFDSLLVEEALLKEEGWRINWIAGLGFGDKDAFEEFDDMRLPRLDFDEACKIK